MNAQKEKTSGVQVSSRKPTKKVCDECESRKNKRRAPKIFFDGRKEFIRRMRKTGVMDIKRLQVTDSSYIEGSYYMFSKRMNRCQGDDFTSMDARTGTIKLALAGTQDWWHRFPPLLGY